MTDEQAAEPVDVEICGIMTHPPRVYVEWVRAFIRQYDLERVFHRTGKQEDRERFEAAKRETDTLREQLDRIERSTGNLMDSPA